MKTKQTEFTKNDSFHILYVEMQQFIKTGRHKQNIFNT